MLPLQIANTYLRVKSNFSDENVSYFDCEYYNTKYCESALKLIDYKFLEDKTNKSITLFFIWCFFEHNVLNLKKNTRSLYQSDDFKKFVLDSSNYKYKLEEDFALIYNAKSFESLKKLYYRKEIFYVSFYVACIYLYSDNIASFSKSAVYGLLWFKLERIMKFIKLDNEYCESYIERIKG